ncbi:sensor histidine kinase [Kyrpidia tusciae]|uniref:histidine kinase n=1 Tax=Kyrpidia tusciae (strain DSM 2912 / NBRC 15312 / T2) TaxID=562970 RepID=D5WU68_KYRT2|nr:HAMP domain-containing sensor histidine kinase [Kyrpidia tusciae]ADG07320.1 integral membrane sensor signal transduction histidine kinase [Kyrpidia tusciae DSM 2912]
MTGFTPQPTRRKLRQTGIQAYLKTTRWRLTASYVGILLVVELIIGLFAGVLLHHQVVRDVEHILQSHLPKEENHEWNEDHEHKHNTIPMQTIGDDRPAYEVGYYVVADKRWYTPYTSGVLPYQAGADRVSATGNPELQLITASDGTPFYVYSMPTFHDGTLTSIRQSAMDATLPLDVMRHFNMLLTTFIILASAAAVIGGYILAGRALRPIAQMAKRQQSFTADASHQLRTPLTVIRTTAELALGTDDPEEWRDALETTVAETHHMSRMVESLATLARMDYEEGAVKRSPFAVRDLVEEVAAHIEPLAGEKGVAFHAPEAGEDRLVGDQHRIWQLLTVLLENAIKYTPEGGHVYFSYRRNGPEAVFTVRDTGIGIAREELPHIFDRFYRGSVVQKERIPGSGLGLSIAKEIAELHGGTIHVDSEVGVGTTFTVSLPIAGQKKSS